MADRYSRWDDEDQRSPYDSRYRERDWRYGSRDRAFFERFVDELRSWFGDEEAQRRRVADEREEARHREEWDGRADAKRYAGLSSAGSFRDRDWTSGPHYGRGPRNYQRADERIREDVCERLAQHSYLDPSDVEILVVSGDVTLQGTVSDRWAKRTAEEIAENVWGVKQVHNQLRIGQDMPNRAPQRGTWAA